MSNFSAILKRDIKLMMRKKGVIINYIVFFILVASMFPLSLGADSILLQRIGAGVIWVAALFVANLSLGNVFDDDFESGVLEQLILKTNSSVYIIGAKLLSHWILSGLPLVIISPLLGAMFGLEAKILLAIFISLFAGTLNISLISVMGATLMLGSRRAGVVSAIMVMPLYIPVLIFGTGAASSAGFGFLSEQFLSNIAGIFAIFMLILPLGLWSSAKSIKIALEE